jgi:uncharacterized coiled-coil protein SlyX
MEHIIIAVIGLFSGIVTVLLGWFGSRFFHIGPQQELLVKTLQSVIEAQDAKIKALEAEIAEQLKLIDKLNDQIDALWIRVKETEKVLVDQEKELHKLDKDFV